MELVRLDLVADDNVQTGRALDDLHDLVALQMPLPAAGAAEARGEQGAVAEVGELHERRLRLLLGGMRPAAFQPDQTGQIAVQIDGCNHYVLPIPAGSFHACEAQSPSPTGRGVWGEGWMPARTLSPTSVK